MRILLRVKPGASRTAVGGRYDGAAGPALVVAVAARAVEGQATKAVLEAIAAAFGVRRSAVTLVRGAISRDKLVEVEGDDTEIRPRLEELLGRMGDRDA
ncbi:DUF167 domain-containing protein [Kribbella capetownensis]|uniref:UPF0235 protein E0H75_35985 n=1 Tax=Kribbella capetownensis TaxID=1572659 RepID=A0A4R0JF98_9ACTN|nr:DUF167 domain-containing protein [Kribbella capetownensis]TCC44254.1 DUF167 domain-containing protein [Kribbella capetownensis]